MSRYRVHVETAEWSLESDTDNPVGLVDGRALVTPLVCQWGIEQLPPVATPDTVTIQVYDDGSNVGNWPGPWWLPTPLGAPISCYVWAESASGSEEAQLVVFQGRIADATAVNVKGGGLLFTLICAGRLADWNSTNAPTFTEPLSQGIPSWPTLVYDAVATNAGMPAIDTDDGSGIGTGWEYGRAWDTTGLSAGDVLGQIALQDFRGNVPIASHWLVYDADHSSDSPDLTPRQFVTAPYYTSINDLVGLLNLFWDGSLWDVELNPSFYSDPDAGMALYASQLLQDVGNWITNRASTINTTELTGFFEVDPLIPALGSAESVRVEHPDLSADGNRQTRTLQSPIATLSDAIDVATQILGPRDQIETGFGLTQATIVWHQLTDTQVDHWGSQLWPTADTARAAAGGPLGGPLGRPVAIVDIPDDWRLADSIVVMGRLMGCTMTFDVATPSPDGVLAADGIVTLALTLRAIPPAANGGITLDDIATLTTPTAVTLDNIAPWLTIDHMSLVSL